MPAALIDQVARLIAQKPLASMATAAAPLNAAQLRQPSVVKVVCDRDGYALLFSRAAVPWTSGEDISGSGGGADIARRHLGIYAYRREYLRRFTKMGGCELERREKLEQLRALWHGDKSPAPTRWRRRRPGWTPAPTWSASAENSPRACIRGAHALYSPVRSGGDPRPPGHFSRPFFPHR